MPILKQKFIIPCAESKARSESECWRAATPYTHPPVPAWRSRAGTSGRRPRTFGTGSGRWRH